jgi:hypothetical protein
MLPKEVESTPMHGEVNQKNVVDEALTKSLYLLAKTRGGIHVLLKSIVILVCLVLIGIVNSVAFA